MEPFDPSVLDAEIRLLAHGAKRADEWLMPGLMWAMGVTEYGLGVAGKIHLHNTQDLGIAV